MKTIEIHPSPAKGLYRVIAKAGIMTLDELELHANAVQRMLKHGRAVEAAKAAKSEV